MYKLGKRSLGNLVGVHPQLAWAVTEAIKITKQDFTVLEGVRTSKRQRELYNTGKSKTLRSYHLNGLAVDLVPFVNGKLTWEDEYFVEIHAAMDRIIKKYSLPIENGFDLWGWDKPHYQMTGMRAEYDVRRLRPKLFRG